MKFSIFNRNEEKSNNLKGERDRERKKIDARYISNYGNQITIKINHQKNQFIYHFETQKQRNSKTKKLHQK